MNSQNNFSSEDDQIDRRTHENTDLNQTEVVNSFHTDRKQKFNLITEDVNLMLNQLKEAKAIMETLLREQRKKTPQQNAQVPTPKREYFDKTQGDEIYPEMFLDEDSSELSSETSKYHISEMDNEVWELKIQMVPYPSENVEPSEGTAAADAKIARLIHEFLNENQVVKKELITLLKEESLQTLVDVEIFYEEVFHEMNPNVDSKSSIKKEIEEVKMKTVLDNIQKKNPPKNTTSKEAEVDRKTCMHDLVTLWNADLSYKKKHNKFKLSREEVNQTIKELKEYKIKMDNKMLKQKIKKIQKAAEEMKAKKYSALKYAQDARQIRNNLNGNLHVKNEPEIVSNECDQTRGKKELKLFNEGINGARNKLRQSTDEIEALLRDLKKKTLQNRINEKDSSKNYDSTNAQVDTKKYEHLNAKCPPTNFELLLNNDSYHTIRMNEIKLINEYTNQQRKEIRERKATLETSVRSLIKESIQNIFDNDPRHNTTSKNDEDDKQVCNHDLPADLNEDLPHTNVLKELKINPEEVNQAKENLRKKYKDVITKEMLEEKIKKIQNYLESMKTRINGTPKDVQVVMQTDMHSNTNLHAKNESEAVFKEEPKTVLKVEPEIVLKEEPEKVVNDESETVLKEEPETVLNDESETVLKEETHHTRHMKEESHHRRHLKELILFNEKTNQTSKNAIESTAKMDTVVQKLNMNTVHKTYDEKYPQKYTSSKDANGATQKFNYFNVNRHVKNDLEILLNDDSRRAQRKREAELFKEELNKARKHISEFRARREKVIQKLRMERINKCFEENVSPKNNISKDVEVDTHKCKPEATLKENFSHTRRMKELKLRNGKINQAEIEMREAKAKAGKSVQETKMKMMLHNKDSARKYLNYE